MHKHLYDNWQYYAYGCFQKSDGHHAFDISHSVYTSPFD